MAVEWVPPKNKTLTSQALERIQSLRGELFDPSKTNSVGLKSAVYGSLFGSAVLALDYLSDDDNYEFTKNYWMSKFGVSSSSTKVPIKSPTPQKVVGVNGTGHKAMLTSVLESQKETSSKYNEMVSQFLSKADELRDSSESESLEIAQQTGATSPLLNNQVYLKRAVDDLTIAIHEQTGVLASSVGVLDLHLGAIVSLLGIQTNAKMKEADAKVYETVSQDYGDSNFFYSFIPTYEYWSQVDLAQVYEAKSNGGNGYVPVFLSSLYRSGEISLIDEMEGNYPKSQIRSKIEDYRKVSVPISIRSMIGSSLSTQASEQSALNDKAKEFYDSVSKSLDVDSEVGVFNALISSLAPVAQWADKAKIREDYLTTPVPITDMDGNVLSENLAPMVLSSIKDASVAREKTDTNTLEFDDDDLPSFSDLSLPILPFVGRERVFDLNSDIPSSNPFSSKNI